MKRIQKLILAGIIFLLGFTPLNAKESPDKYIERLINEEASYYPGLDEALRLTDNTYPGYQDPDFVVAGSDETLDMILVKRNFRVIDVRNFRANLNILHPHEEAITAVVVSFEKVGVINGDQVKKFKDVFVRTFYLKKTNDSFSIIGVSDRWRVCFYDVVLSWYKSSIGKDFRYKKVYKRLESLFL